MMTNYFSIELSLIIFLVSTGSVQVSGNQENCVCELGDNLNCTKFRCPIDKCGHFPSSYNLTCLCEKETNQTNGCQVFKPNHSFEVRSCNEYHPFICFDSNNNYQIYAEENKTWSDAVKACEERNLHIAQENISVVNHPSNVSFWIGTFFGTPSTSNIDVSQYQMTANVSEINSSYKCEIQSEMFLLPTTTVSPSSPTVNLTSESPSPTPSNETLPVSNVTAESLLSGSPSTSYPAKNITDTSTTSTTETNTNYERTSETSSATETPVAAVITTSGSNILSPSSDSGTTTSSSEGVNTTDPSKKRTTETTTHPGSTTEISSVEIVTISLTSDIPTASRKTTTSDNNITSPSQGSYPPTSSSVDNAVTNYGSTTEPTSTVTQTEPSASTKSADLSTSATTTTNNKPLNNGSTGNVTTSTMSVTDTNILSTAAKAKHGSSDEARQEGPDNTPVLAGALSGGAVLIIIGATVIYIRYRRNQNQSKKHITKGSGIAGYTDRSLRGKPGVHIETRNPVYLPDSHVSPNNLGYHGKDATPESDDENKYDHFEKKNTHNDKLESDTYDHTRLDIQEDSSDGYGVLHQKKDNMADDLYDHTGVLNEGTYGQIHRKDGAARADTDMYDTSF